MRYLLAATIIICFLTVAVAAEEYTGTVGVNDLTTTASSNVSNYSLTLTATTIAASANSSNYSLTLEPFTLDTASNTTVPPSPPPANNNDDDDDDSSSSSRSTSSGDTTITFTESKVTDEEKVFKTLSFTSFVTSQNHSITMSSPLKDMSFTGLQAGIKQDYSGVPMKIIEYGDDEAKEESDSFTGRSYRLFEIQHDDLPEEDVENITLSFKVSRSWLLLQNVSFEEVLLFRYSNESWQELDTEYNDADSDFRYYIATSPGLSLFTVGVKEELPLPPPVQILEEETQTTATEEEVEVKEPIPEPTGEDPFLNEKKKGPWFFIIVGFILVGGMVGGVLFMIKKKEKNLQAAEETVKKTLSAKKEPKKIFKKGVEKPVLVEDETNKELIAEEPTRVINEKEKPKSPFKLPENEAALTAYLQRIVDSDHSAEPFMKTLEKKGWTKEQIKYCMTYTIKKK